MGSTCYRLTCLFRVLTRKFIENRVSDQPFPSIQHSRDLSQPPAFRFRLGRDPCRVGQGGVRPSLQEKADDFRTVLFDRDQERGREDFMKKLGYPPRESTPHSRIRSRGGNVWFLIKRGGGELQVINKLPF